MASQSFNFDIVVELPDTGIRDVTGSLRFNNDANCRLPLPFNELVLRRVDKNVQDYDKNLEAIKKLSSFKARVINNENKPKLEKFLGYLAQRNKAARLKSSHFPSGTCAFLLPQLVNPNDGTIVFYQAAPNYVPPIAPPVISSVSSFSSTQSESLKRGFDEGSSGYSDDNRPPSPAGLPSRPRSPPGLPSLQSTTLHSSSSSSSSSISTTLNNKRKLAESNPHTPDYAPPGWVNTAVLEQVKAASKHMKFKPISPNYAPPGWMGDPLPPRELFSPNNITSSTAASGGGTNTSTTANPVDDKWGGDQSVAASAYSKLVRTKESMSQSRMYHMRRLNNCIKMALINDSMKKVKKRMIGQANMPINVLDLSCGKGGDFDKLCSYGSISVGRYVGIDIAQGSLKDAVQRVVETKQRPRPGAASSFPSVRFALADIGSKPLEQSMSEVWEIQRQTPTSNDLWEQDVALNRKSEQMFHLASMQFAFHYMFETLDRARLFFKDLSSWLVEDGVFIATTIDPKVMVEMLMTKAEKVKKVLKHDENRNNSMNDEEGFSLDDTDDSPCQWVISVHDPTEGDNRYTAESELDRLKQTRRLAPNDSLPPPPPPPPPVMCTITFDQEDYDRIMKPASTYEAISLETTNQNSVDANAAVGAINVKSSTANEAYLQSMCGIRYYFRLYDSADSAAVEAPEWLLPQPLLEALANEAGLELSYAYNFHDFLALEEQPSSNPQSKVLKVPMSMLERMHVLNFQGTLSKPEWEVSRFYQVLQFTKKSTQSSSSAGGSKPKKSEAMVRLAALKKMKAEFGPRLKDLPKHEKEARLKFYFEELMEEE